MADITLEPGSPSHRIASYLRGAGAVSLDRHDVAQRLSIAPAAVDGALRPGVDLGLITLANDSDSGRVWRAGPRLRAWQQDLAPEPARNEAPAAVKVPAPAPAPGKPIGPPAAAEARGGKRTLLPLLDVKKLVVARDVPVPERRIAMKGATRYDNVFDLLTADGMSVEGIDEGYQHALRKAAQVYLANRQQLKASSTLAVRRIEGTPTCGVWRLAKQAQSATAAPATPATRKPGR